MSLETVPRVDTTNPHAADPTANTTPHWTAGGGRTFGSVMGTIQCIMIHETSGWPTYAGNKTFTDRYSCMVNADRGIGPQYFVETNGTAYTLIGEPEFANQPRETWHAGWPAQHIDMNPFALGIENADIGDSDVRPGNGTGPRWWALSTRSEDLSGLKAYVVLAPGGQEDAVLIWIAKFASEWFIQTPAIPAVKATPTTPAVPAVPAVWALQAGVRPGYQGPGDIVDGTNPTNDRHVRSPVAWRNMLFTERNFRTLVLLCRFLTEKNSLPRNFPLLPYSVADTDWTNAATFRKLILAEQRADDIAVQIGTTKTDIQASTFAAWYAPRARTTWSRFFGAV
ncbi:MAG: peptidoglycan recognition protein family protein, partial [bacterium]